jgi:hypothetical protein
MAGITLPGTIKTGDSDLDFTNSYLISREYGLCQRPLARGKQILAGLPA